MLFNVEKTNIESMLIFGQHFTGETLDCQSLIQHLNMVHFPEI